MTSPRASLVTNLTALVILGVASALLGATLSGYAPYTVDDAFISFRYAGHWASGSGLSWNPGEQPQEGYTSVLHVAVLALLAKAGAPLELTSKVLGLIGMVFALGLAAVLAQRLSRVPVLFSLASVAAGSVAVAHLFPVHAVAGLETTLFAALWLGLALAADEDLLSPRRTQLLAALSLALGLCRPEGNLVAGATWAVVLLAARPPDRRRLALTLVGLYLLPAATYFLWRWQRYGLPLPLPFYVKVGTGSGPQGLQPTVDFLRAIPWGVALLAIGGAAHTMLAQPRWRAARLLLPVAAFLLFFLWPEHVMGFDSRFDAPAVPFVLAFATAGLALALRAGSWAGPVVLVLFAGSQLPWRAPHGQKAWAAARYQSYASGLDAAHRRLGAALAIAGPGWSHTAPLLAIGDCGVIPFMSDWRTLDTFGLNDRDLARSRPPRSDWYVAHVLEASPDVLVLISSDALTFAPHLAWEGLLHDAALGRGYEVLGTLAFASNYHLWLLVQPGEPGARTLAAELGL